MKRRIRQIGNAKRTASTRKRTTAVISWNILYRNGFPLRPINVLHRKTMMRSLHSLLFLVKKRRIGMNRTFVLLRPLALTMKRLSWTHYMITLLFLFLLLGDGLVGKELLINGMSTTFPRRTYLTRSNRNSLRKNGNLAKIPLTRVTVTKKIIKFTTKLLLMSLRPLIWDRSLRLFVIRPIIRELW